MLLCIAFTALTAYNYVYQKKSRNLKYTKDNPKNMKYI